ncbi:uncharacterized protein LOC120933538 [Rana temporaria]|uniref:uncharacterized protein LOC120933538 n=1 Tax=Rana temporaria TaxID=8407 RepID=UPI001AADEE99|nr:uncharacterized protein LOC120933538 [Rana temporaria]
MRLFILISLSYLGITGSPVCVHQMTTHTIQSRGSVTIPCSYSDPGIPDEDVRVTWRETDREYCSSVAAEDTIISPSGNVTEKYEGRLSREKDPNRNRTEYIRITGLESTDGPRFCCLLYNIRYGNTFKESRIGTLLQFSGTEYITQMDEVMAVSGEEVIIPCYYSKDTSDITNVIWYYADQESHDCTHTPIHERSNAPQYGVGRYSLVNFTQDVSLRIHNLHVNDQRSYCCVISTTRETLKSKQFTTLVVAESQPSRDQPTNEISVEEGHSALLSCSYTLPSDRYTERDVLRVNVYWRVGNVTGPYAYHPYQEMVHSTYINRTSITGRTNLMIKDVMKADNTSFHCFVALKLCASDYQDDDKIQYGGGIRLIINGDVAGRTTNGINGEGSKLTFQDLMIIVVVSSVTIMIILIVILIILKVKGVICKKKTNFSEQQMDSIQAAGVVTSEEAPYCEISTKKPEDVLKAATDETEKTEMGSGQMEDGEEGNLLYAKLNQTKLKEKRPAEIPKQNEEVVYAAVVNTTTK